MPPLVVPYLADMDEGVRYAAVEALVRHKNEEIAREPLLQHFVSESEDSLRIRLQIAEGFTELGVAGERPPRRGREKASRAVPAGPRGPLQEKARCGATRDLIMPKRTDIKTVMLIGSGPIVIGQACEFDYSGTQGVKALKEEGYRVVLVNSNPATIMTDPEIADRTYVEPLTLEVLTAVIERERPDALLPTLGGQTALNLAIELDKAGVLEKYGVQLIGAQIAAIEKAEDRELFKKAMQKIGLSVPLSGYAHSLAEAKTIQGEIAAADRRRLPDDPAAVVHARRLGRGHRLERRGVRRQGVVGPVAEPARRGADRGVGARLERVRARGHARPRTTTRSSSARSRTSIRWACTPAIRSRSRRR